MGEDGSLLGANEVGEVVIRGENVTARRGDMQVSPLSSKFGGSFSMKVWIFCGVFRRLNTRSSAGVSSARKAFR